MMGQTENLEELHFQYSKCDSFSKYDFNKVTAVEEKPI